MRVTYSAIGMAPAAEVRDLWVKTTLGTFAGEFSAYVPAHGVVLVRIHAK